jgi:hypothetical protein
MNGVSFSDGGVNFVGSRVLPPEVSKVLFALASKLGKRADFTLFSTLKTEDIEKGKEELKVLIEHLITEDEQQILSGLAVLFMEKSDEADLAFRAQVLLRICPPSIELLRFAARENVVLLQKIYRPDETLLFEAALHGNVEAVKFLLTKMQTTKSLITFLSAEPAFFDHASKILPHLAQAGYSAEVPDCRGRVALHYAKEVGHLDELLPFIQENSPRDALGDTPLHLAAFNLQKELTEHLLQCGADPNMPNHIGQTPLHLVVQNRPDPQSLLRSEVDLEIAELLIEKGALAAYRDHEGKTPLHLLIDQEGIRRELFEKFLSHIESRDFVHGKDPKLGCSLYGYAARHSRGEYLGALLRKFKITQ